ncbi:MAG: Gar1/Naf1 family protein [Methanimicrococcus sp.]|nr:Gar1/Naf1 family protein [Methanimicrococcus sp.]
MKRLGTVSHLHGKSCLVVKSDAPDASPLHKMMNLQVIDKSVRPVGKVVTVFGPEEQPYFLIRIYRELDAAQAKKLVKEKVYVK